MATASATRPTISNRFFMRTAFKAQVAADTARPGIAENRRNVAVPAVLKV
jgi:hypothetical protein